MKILAENERRENESRIKFWGLISESLFEAAEGMGMSGG
jgi:hypothetical protein